MGCLVKRLASQPTGKSRSHLGKLVLIMLVWAYASALWTVACAGYPHCLCQRLGDEPGKDHSHRGHDIRLTAACIFFFFVFFFFNVKHGVCCESVFKLMQDSSSLDDAEAGRGVPCLQNQLLEGGAVQIHVFVHDQLPHLGMQP